MLPSFSMQNTPNSMPTNSKAFTKLRNRGVSTLIEFSNLKDVFFSKFGEIMSFSFRNFLRMSFGTILIACGAHLFHGDILFKPYAFVKGY